jgi:hypothetical protein
MMTSIGLKSMIFSLVMLPALAAAGSLGSPHEERARASAQRLAVQDPGYEDFQKTVVGAWQKKCGKTHEGDRACWLLECDVAPAGQCRADRVLLFRGEPKLYPTPSVSSFLRTHWSQSRYAPDKDVHGALEQLRADVQLIRPSFGSPDEGESFLLQRQADGKVAADRWIYGPSRNDSGDDEDPNAPPVVIGPDKVRPNSGPAASLLQMLFTYHVQFSYFFYEDPQLGNVGLDPMISYSLDPEVAIAFARPDDGQTKNPELGRVIVASVPSADVVRDCGEKLPEPGSIWDPGSCEDTGQFDDERELDAFVYLSPDYAWKSFHAVGVAHD